MKINTHRLFWISLGIGWLFDLLFWGKAMGISFFMFAAAAIAGGMEAARREGVEPHRNSQWLLAPIFFFSLMSAVRLEPMSVFLDLTLTLLFMGLFAVSYVGGRWPFYRLRDHLLRFSSLAGATLIRWTKLFGGENGEGKGRARGWGTALRGLLLALPIFFVFGGLLASADAVFKEYFEAILELLQIENLLEYIQRGVLILLVAGAMFGVFWQAITASEDKELPGDRIKVIRFLGFTEAVVGIGTAILLFATFVAIQFRYFFFGEANVTVNGFTYAEYARRGFFELVVVAVFSLALFFSLSTFTKRESERQQKVFSWLGIVLVALVAVILVSAFQRLTLYEQAYGFTRLRTYAHVFMVWLGLLLAAAAALEAVGRSERFAIALLLAAAGFGASLNVLNVDAFITRANIAQAFQFESLPKGEGYDPRSPAQVLDLAYLFSLSPDAVPTLQRLYETARASGDPMRAGMAAGALSCQAYRWDGFETPEPWQSFRFSTWRAREIWLEHAEDLDSFGLQFDDSGDPYFEVEGEQIFCAR